MKTAPIPPRDAERLDALRRYEVLDTAPEPAFDDLALLAARIIGTPIALVSIVDADRQWFKARYGLDAPETPRDVSFCGHVVADEALLVVPDARRDPRFADNPLVTGEPRVGFYVGAPLRTPDGHVLGSLCAIDHEPRQVTAEQLQLLGVLARQVVTLLETRRVARRASNHQLLFEAGLACAAGHDGFFKSLTPAWAELLGRTIEELLSRPFVDFIHPDDVAATLAQLEGLARGRNVVAFENRFLHRSGAWRWLLWHAVSDPAAGLMHAVATDLTPLRQGEASLRESEARHRALVDHLGDGVITIDERGIIERVNPSTELIFGYTAGELVGQNVKLLMPSPTRELHDEYLRRYLSGGPPGIIGSRREVEGLRKDGSRVPLELSVTDIALGQSKLFVGVVRDISTRKRDAAELQSVLDLQRAILRGAAYAIISTDTEGVIQSFNPAAERMLGYAAEDLVGKLTPGVFHAPREVEQRATELSAELGRAVLPGFEVFVAKARAGEVEEREWTYVRKDGIELPVMLSVSALRNEVGQVKGFLGIAADVTERKAVEKLQSEFVSTVSHELRTPLTAIRGSLGLLVGGALGQLPEGPLEMVRLALSNCDRLVRLINDILDIERIQNGQVNFSMHDIDVREVVESTVAANLPYAAQFGVVFDLITPSVAAPAHVDEDRLAQVLSNLLSNAAKFSPPNGHVDVGVERVGQRVVVSVRDRGRGIPEAFRARMFQRFSQVDASDARKRGGAGLGLAITKSLVERMGGTLSFADADGGGTVFRVELPEVVLHDRPRPASEVPQPQSSTRSAAGRRKVLLVEDDEDAARVLCMGIESWGFELRRAANIAQAQTALGAQLFDVVLLDIGLPDGSGLTLASDVRRGTFGQSPPCIVVSARPEQSRFAPPFWIDWIEKPPDPERLRAAIARAVKQARPARVLLVEDDPDVSHVTAMMLGGLGVELEVTTTAEAALAIVPKFMPDLLIIDIGLPGMDGFELIAALRHSDARALPVVVYSGRAIAKDDIERLHLGATRVLTKAGVSQTEFVEAVRELLGGTTS